VRKEVRLLHSKAQDSILLAVDHFNRVEDRGRPEAVLVLLDRSLELLLKAALLHRGDRIRDNRASNTIGFDACVRRGLSGEHKFLGENQAIGLQALNGLRDAAQHYLLDIREEQLYMKAMAGVTLFRDVAASVFDQDLAQLLPQRAMPLSTVAPTDIATLFTHETAEVLKLMQPGTRRRTEAYVRLRPLAILDGNLRGVKSQPTEADLARTARRLVDGVDWQDVFPGAAAVELTTEGSGPTLSLRITKKEGIPIRLVPEGTAGESVVGVKRVNELDYYNLGHNEVASKIGISAPKLTAIVHVYELASDPDLTKKISLGGVTATRYSQQALARVRTILSEESLDNIWSRSGMGRRR
jgi:hypothetical protein